MLFLIVLGCEPLKEDSCGGGEAESTVSEQTPPDFQIVDAVSPNQSIDDYLTGTGNVTIEAWDCLDIAWWNGSGPQKVVQVWSDTAGCGYYDTVDVFTYECDSLQGPDLLYRDLDGDGLRPVDGDCDDSNPDILDCAE